MSPAVWQRILDAWTGLGQALDASLPAGAPADAALLAKLRGDLRARLADLISALTALGVASQEVAQVLEPIAIFTDERVLLRLPPEVAVSWSRLEYDMNQTNDGGVRFYQNADRLLQPGASVSELAREVHAFCLNEGFCGALADDRPRLQLYKDAFARAIVAAEPQPAAAPASASSAAASATAAASSIWQAPDRVYYLAAAVVGVALAAAIPLVAHALL